MHPTVFRLPKLLTPLLAGIALHAYGAEPSETITQPDSQNAVSITIYNADLALVKDQRRIDLKSGEHVLAWRGVSAGIRPETALLRNTDTNKALALIEQNFDFDLLTPNKLLEKNVGQKVQVIKTHPHTGAETKEEAILLSVNSGVVLQFPDRIETAPNGRIVFSTVPTTLRDKPTLVVHFNNPSDGPQHLELSYLTSGLSWKADYVAELASDEKSLDLNAWITLTNKSGAAYNHAKLQLVAGDIHQIRDPELRDMSSPAVVALGRVAKTVQEEALLDYHLYTLERLTTLRENQTKQIALLSASHVPAIKTYRLEGHPDTYQTAYELPNQKLKISVNLQFENKTPELGTPLPSGIVRVYKRDSQGNAQLVGEDRIEHTAKNAPILLRLGEAFDVTATRKQLNFKRIDPATKREQVFESTYEIQIDNAKPEPISVQIQEPIPGTWTILQESHPHTKEHANTTKWQIPVPAEGQTKLQYRIRTRF